MKVMLEPTEARAYFTHDAFSIPCRVWQGTSDLGVPVVALIPLIEPQTTDPAVMKEWGAEMENPARCTLEPYASAPLPLHIKG